MAQPEISVIVPTYNHETYIGECLDSIIGQTYTDWEAIVVDDGSTDATWAVVQEKVRQDRRIRAITQDNQGVWCLANTLNRAVAMANGRLVATIGGDDYWPKQKLEAQVQLHQATPDLILSYGRVEIINHGRVNGEFCHPPITGVQPAANYLRLQFLRTACIAAVGAVVRTDCLRQIGGYHQEFGFPGEDYPTFIRLLQLPGKAAWVDTFVGYYRRHDQQITHSYGTVLAEAALRIAVNQYDGLANSLGGEINISRAQIIRAHNQKAIIPSYGNDARLALRNRDKTAARRYAFKLLLHGTLKRKLQGLYTIIAAQFGWTMEPIYSAFNKPTLGKPYHRR